jgi:hypothetical protein
LLQVKQCCLVSGQVTAATARNFAACLSGFAGMLVVAMLQMLPAEPILPHLLSTKAGHDRYAPLINLAHTHKLSSIPFQECVMTQDRNLVSYYYSPPFVDEYVRRARGDYAGACSQLRKIAAQLIEMESAFRNHSADNMRFSRHVGETLSLEQLLALCKRFAIKLESHLYVQQAKVLPELCT